MISNARVIVGDGQVIDRGTVTVRNGKIVSVTAGPARSIGGVTRIDGTGKTLIAGYIDAHRHLIAGPADKFLREQAADRMRELLEAGFTTVQSGGDDNAGILELKRMIESGQIKGPRILTSARVPVPTMSSEEESPRRDSCGEGRPARIPSPRCTTRRRNRRRRSRKRKLGI